MRSSHCLDGRETDFEDDRLVANARLLLQAMLAPGISVWSRSARPSGVEVGSGIARSRAKGGGEVDWP